MDFRVIYLDCEGDNMKFRGYWGTFAWLFSRSVLISIIICELALLFLGVAAVFAGQGSFDRFHEWLFIMFFPPIQIFIVGISIFFGLLLGAFASSYYDFEFFTVFQNREEFLKRFEDIIKKFDFYLETQDGDNYVYKPHRLCAKIMKVRMVVQISKNQARIIGSASYVKVLKMEMQQKCKNCGNEIEAWAKFCPKCGAELLFKGGK